MDDVLENGVFEHERDIEGTQTPQALPARKRYTLAELKAIALDMNIPVIEGQDEGLLMRMIRAEQRRRDSSQSANSQAELNPVRDWQSFRLDSLEGHAKRSPSPTAMADQITIKMEELSELVKSEVLRALVNIGANAEVISKAKDDDWAFAEEETEQTRNTSAGALLSKKKTEVFEPKFEEASGEIEIQLPPNVKSLDHWSTAVVQQGKFQGQSYKTAFDNYSYRKWLMDNFGSLKSPAIVDLAKYVICQYKADMAKATA